MYTTDLAKRRDNLFPILRDGNVVATYEENADLHGKVYFISSAEERLFANEAKTRLRTEYLQGFATHALSGQYARQIVRDALKC